MLPPAILKPLLLARAVLALVCLTVLAVPWLLAGASPALQRRIAALGWKALLAGFGIRLKTSGQPRSGVLFVANHVSWVDIPALGLTLGAAFVAKEEVGRWPVIGPLAQRLGCLFIRREQRLGAGSQVQSLRRRLGPQTRLVLFPEGTTGMGWDVLPFRSSLFASVGAGPAGYVQPVALHYANRDGSSHGSAERRKVAWLGADALVPHALALALGGGAMLELVFCDPVRADCRKALARSARDVIAAALAERQEETLKRAA